jgi:hypothetical protein
MGLGDKYREAWEALIKPPKFHFDKYLLGPEIQVIDEEEIKCSEFRIKNADNFLIEGTTYVPVKNQKRLNLVIYLHTRGGCRLEGLFLQKVLLPRIGLVLFDFAGSGYSEGEYITLGIKEARDTKLVINFLKNKYDVDKIFLWGRSMGAVTAILFSQEEENQKIISGLILDSPFSSFKKMIYDVVSSKVKVSTCLINMLLYFLMKTVKKKTGVDLSHIKPIECVNKINIPGFFLVCKNDIIARPDKVKDLYIKYKSKSKEFHLVPGEHQTNRENNILVSAIYFLLQGFGIANKPILNINNSFLETHRHSEDINNQI